MPAPVGRRAFGEFVEVAPEQRNARTRHNHTDQLYRRGGGVGAAHAADVALPQKSVGTVSGHRLVFEAAEIGVANPPEPPGKPEVRMIKTVVS